MKFKLKQLGLAVVVTSLCLSSLAFGAAIVFTDQVRFDSWFASSVVDMHAKGVIQGYPDGSFRPGNSVNRAELAVILDRYDEYVQGLLVSGDGHPSDLGQYMTESEVESMIAASISGDPDLDVSGLVAAEVQSYLDAELPSQVSALIAAEVDSEIEAEINSRVDDKLEDLLEVIVDDKLDLAIEWQEYRVMAQAEIKRMDSAPTVSLNLHVIIDGYEIYTHSTLMSYGVYVKHYVEEIIDPTVPRGEEEYQTVEHWHGPFDAYHL